MLDVGCWMLDAGWGSIGLTLKYAFSAFTNLSFLFFIVNKALNLIGGRVPCVAWGRNPR